MKLGMVVHIFKSSNGGEGTEARAAGISVHCRPAWSTNWVPGHPGLLKQITGWGWGDGTGTQTRLIRNCSKCPSMLQCSPKKQGSYWYHHSILMLISHSQVDTKKKSMLSFSFTNFFLPSEFCFTLLFSFPFLKQMSVPFDSFAIY